MFAPIARFVRVLRDQRLRAHFKSLTLVYRDGFITIDAQSESAVTQAYGTFPDGAIGLVERLKSGTINIEYLGYSAHGEIAIRAKPDAIDTIEKAVDFIRETVRPDPRTDRFEYLKLLYEAYDPTGCMSDDHRYYASAERTRNEIQRVTSELEDNADPQTLRQLKEAHFNDIVSALLAHNICKPGEASAMVSNDRQRCEAMILASINRPT